MSRDISVIQQQMIDAVNADPVLSAANSPSQTAIWRLWTYVMAVCVNLFEQLLDIFTTNIESVVAKAGAGTLPWLRAQVLKFQYSTTVNQYIQLDPVTLVLSYPVVDATLQILTRAAVTQSANKTVSIKVAQQEPPVPLDNTMVTALSSYLNEIAFAGTQISIVNKAADSLIVSGTVLYTGQYSATIQSDVITALNNYCTNLSSAENFGSAVKATDIIKVILNVPGVTDFKATEISVRPDGVAIGSRNKVFELSSGTDNISFDTISGYIVQESTSGWDFAATLTFQSV